MKANTSWYQEPNPGQLGRGSRLATGPPPVSFVLVRTRHFFTQILGNRGHKKSFNPVSKCDACGARINFAQGVLPRFLQSASVHTSCVWIEFTFINFQQLISANCCSLSVNLWRTIRTSLCLTDLMTRSSATWTFEERCLFVPRFQEFQFYWTSCFISLTNLRAHRVFHQINK